MLNKINLNLLIALILAAILADSIYSSFTFPLLNDESYYWLWSKKLATGYYDHPPMIAWILALTTSLVGDTIFAVRLPGIVAWLVSAAALWSVTKAIYSSRAGWLALALFALSPTFQAVIMVTTPDTPLLFFSALYLLCLQYALTRRKLLYWLILGLTTALVGLSKYNGVMLPLALALSLCLSKFGRHMLISPAPWLAGLCALLFISPMLWWNYQHQWVSFAFQLDHGFVTDKQEDYLSNFIEFIIVQSIIYFLPIFFVLMMLALSKHFWQRNKIQYKQSSQTEAHKLFVDNTVLVSLLTLALYGYVFTTKGGEYNWLALGYFTGIIPLAGLLERYSIRGNKQKQRVQLVLLGSALTAALLIFSAKNLHLIEALTGIPTIRTQQTNAYGWQQTGEDLQRIINSNKAYQSAQCSIALDSHTTAAWLAWNLRNIDQVVHYSETGRKSQFDLWRVKPGYPEPCFLLKVSRGDKPIPALVYFYQQNWSILQTLTNENPDNTTTYITIYTKQQ